MGGFYAQVCKKQQEHECWTEPVNCRSSGQESEPVVLGVGEGDDGEAELAEEDGVFEDGGGAHVVEGLFLLEALAGLDADFGVLGVGGVDGDDFGGADGGFAYVGVVDDEFFAVFHAAEVEEGGGVGDAVPGGLAVADEVVEGVFAGFGLEEVGHRFGSIPGGPPPR